MVPASAEKLVAEFLKRRQRNERYSERAFAKSAGISPGFLKLVFQGKRFMSLEKAREVAFRLGWSDIEAQEFLSTVGSEKKTRTGQSAGQGRAISDFVEISDWYNFAIVEILKTRKSISVEEISNRLGISATEATYSLRALAKAGLIILRNDAPEAVDAYVVPAMSSSAIRKFHAQMLTKARAAIEEQPVGAREIRALTLAFDSSQQAEAAAMIKSFMRSFEKRFSKGRPDKVYQLCLAFFSLEKEGSS